MIDNVPFMFIGIPTNLGRNRRTETQIAIQTFDTYNFELRPSVNRFLNIFKSVDLHMMCLLKYLYTFP